MGTGAVTLGGTTVTSFIDRTQSTFEFQANRLNGIANLVLRDDTGALVVRERMEVLATDDGTRFYGGQVATIKRDFDGKALVYTLKCQSFDCLLDHRVIESGLRDGAGRFDDDDVDFIIGFGADLGLTSADFVSRISSTALPAIDYSGKTLRVALALLAKTIGAGTFWVDEFKKVHWLNPQSAQKVVNGDFEAGSASWSTGANIAFTDGAGPGGSGDTALVISLDNVGSSQTITGLVGNRRYMVFADLYGSSVDGARVRFEWKNSSSVVQQTDDLENDSTTGAWVRKKLVTTVPASVDRVTITCSCTSAATQPSKFDNVNLIGQDAAFSVSTAPNGTTIKRLMDWEQPSDAAIPINRVLVKGSGISGWREHAASIAYYGGAKFEGVVEDDDIVDSAGIDASANKVFRERAFPILSGKYLTSDNGLVAGTWQIIEVPAYGISAIEWIATIKAAFIGNGTMLYEVRYGAPADDLSAVMAAVGSAFGGEVVTGVEDPTTDVDTNPPAVPTGLALQTDDRQQPDGSLSPYLLATWNANADTDLDGYELAIDRAIDGDVTFAVSASGTGGALPAGTYAVQITGNGTVAGETGTTTSPKFVTLTSGQRLFVNITAKAGCATYRAYASILTGIEDQPKATAQTAIATTGSNVEITAAGSGGYPPTSSTAVSFLNPTLVRTSQVAHYTETVLSNTYYAARLRAYDIWGNDSAWTSVVGVVIALDTVAPSVPVGLSAVPGFRLVGLNWQRNPEIDIARYDVRWTTDDPATTTDWTVLRSASSTIVVTGLEPLVQHYFQVQAVDRSGNVSGWSNTLVADYISATPLNVGQTDIAAGSIISEHISTVGLDADVIKAGTLSIGGAANVPDFLLVFNQAGEEIGRWDANGLLIKDPVNTARQVRMLNGVLSFSGDGGATWTTAIDSQGITADAIKVGIAPGGHNSIPNASFELTEFSLTQSKVWTAITDWATSLSSVNVNTGATELKLSDASYAGGGAGGQAFVRTASDSVPIGTSTAAIAPTGGGSSGGGLLQLPESLG